MPDVVSNCSECIHQPGSWRLRGKSLSGMWLAEENTPLTQDPGKVSAIVGAWDSMPWHRTFRPLLRTDWWLSIYLWCLLGARPIWGFLRGPSERTKGMLVLCFCPGADLAKSSLGLRPSPQRTQVCGFWELNSYPWAVIISPRAAASDYPLFFLYCLISFLMTILFPPYKFYIKCCIS